MGYPVGKSSFTDGTSTSPYGKVQEVGSAFAARQVASLCYEFDTTFPGARDRGDRLTINEGLRPRERQRILRAAWEAYRDGRGPWAALAAALYYSTHDESRGSGLDFGITMADGRNRAMTPAEAAWVNANGPRRGIQPTGNGFNPPESWHKNAGYAFSVAPIDGVNQPGEPLYTDTTSDGPSAALQIVQEETMLAFDVNGDLFAVASGRIRHCTTTREFDLAVASVPGNVRQKTDPTSFRNILRTNGIPVEASDPVWITRNADSDSDGHTWSAVGQLRDLVAATQK